MSDSFFSLFLARHVVNELFVKHRCLGLFLRSGVQTRLRKKRQSLEDLFGGIKARPNGPS